MNTCCKAEAHNNIVVAQQAWLWYDDDHTIFDTFVEWLIQLPSNYPEDTSDDDRPLPLLFPRPAED